MITKLAGKNAVCSIDGEPMAVTGGSYRPIGGTDDMTNLLSEGFGEHVGTIKNCTLNLDAAYDGENPPDFDELDEIAVQITIPGKTAVQHPPDGLPSGPGISGLFLVTEMTYPTVNPQGGVRYSFTAISQGAYVKVKGGVVPTS